MLELPPLQSVPLTTGQLMSWREWGTGTPLIMLHGWSMSSVVFGEVAPKLAEHFRVLCPDLPGHGGSTLGVEEDLSALAAAVCEWAELLSLPEASLLGWSLGGQVALQLASEKSFNINKLLLVATTPRFCQSEDWSAGLPATQVRALERNLRRAYEKTLGDFFNLQFAGEQMSKERYRQILAFAVRTGRLPEQDAAGRMLALLSDADLRENIATIKVPVHLLHGELDKIIPLAAGQYLAQHLADVTFDSLPEIGHAPFFSSPEKSLECWLDFLSDS